MAGTIRVGVGGWVFKPWRGTFFPKGLPQTRELEYASRALTTIEINGTFYRTQKPDTFRKWAAEVPDDFVFSVKGPQFATNRRVLAEAGSSIERFFASGVLELKSKLGPIMWQMAPTKKFDPDDFAAFLALLPPRVDGMAIRHALEVRHASFVDPAFIDLLRKHSVAAVLVDSSKHPPIADVTGDFVYLRLQGTVRQGSGRVSAGGARCLDQAGAGLGWRRHAGGRDADRRRDAAEEAARRVRLHDRRRQGPRPRGRHRDARTAAQSVRPRVKCHLCRQ